MPIITPKPTSAAPSQKSTAFGDDSGGAVAPAAATTAREALGATDETATGALVAVAATIGAVVRATLGTAVADGAVVGAVVGAIVGPVDEPVPTAAHASVSGVPTNAQTDRVA
jgi:hypothetical protein